MDIAAKKIIKKTTPGQFRVLVNLIEQSPELATSSPIFGKTKTELENQWDLLAKNINAIGPPVRSGPDWKKVWADMKCRTKAKIAENAKQVKGTGGGPNCEHILTDLEKDIDRICHLSVAADPQGAAFGVNTKNIEVSDTPPVPEKNVPLTVMGTSDGQMQNPLTILSAPTIHKPSPTTSKPSPTIRKRKLAECAFEEEDEQVKLLKLQLKQNGELIDEMRCQSQKIDSMAQSLEGIKNVLQEMLNFLKDE